MSRHRHPQFPQDQELIYLNHAAVAPWPKCTADALSGFLQENVRHGARYYPEWMKKEDELRELLAWLVNADSANDIALLKNTSEGLSIIAHGLQWCRGDNVVIPEGEFPSNRIVWESLERYGVDVRQVPIRSVADPERALISAMDSRTKILSVSAVQYADGFRLDLTTLGEFCAHQESLFVVDAIQQLGALAFDVQSCKADFVVADGHKWMLGPEGLALFYSNPVSREKLELKQYGWHMIEHPADFNQRSWKIAQSSKRFEPGSPNMIGIIALLASMKLIHETGMDVVEAAVLKNASRIIDYIKKSDQYDLISDSSADRRSGIVTFSHREKDNSSLYKSLMSNGYICAERGGGIRFSPHYYNQSWEFDQVFDYLHNF